uniref:Uncharacterized protein n=1 Tax=Lepeophtheirus salmonis TaxID=72036 RepID=A0A0K2U8N9_LEPSM
MPFQHLLRKFLLPNIISVLWARYFKSIFSVLTIETGLPSSTVKYLKENNQATKKVFAFMIKSAGGSAYFKNVYNCFQLNDYFVVPNLPKTFLDLIFYVQTLKRLEYKGSLKLEIEEVDMLFFSCFYAYSLFNFIYKYDVEKYCLFNAPNPRVSTFIGRMLNSLETAIDVEV